jgi:hypothetical protein
VFSSHTNRGEFNLSRRQADRLSRDPTEVDQESPISAALRDLHFLLEQHAPPWYTEEHHQRGELGLRQGGPAQVDALLKLFHLLEEYAPAWYTEEHHKNAELALQLVKKSTGGLKNRERHLVQP